MDQEVMHGVDLNGSKFVRYYACFCGNFCFFSHARDKDPFRREKLALSAAKCCYTYFTEVARNDKNVVGTCESNCSEYRYSYSYEWQFLHQECCVESMLCSQEEQHVASAPEGFESKCWGCGLRLLLPSYSQVFKCGWCGALTNQNRQRHESRCAHRWRCIQDRIFTTILVLFMLFIIGGGAWAVYPVVFSVGLLCGIFHSTITFILCVSTLCSFWLAAFQSPGDPPNVIWGSYPVVDRGTLENYTLCVYCAKPKSPRTHHCRSCSICVLDMDHHCPFIGNCVGAANHRSFITFLFSIILSTIYASIMAIYAGTHIWPPLDYGNRHLSYYCRMALLSATTGINRAFLTSALHLSARGIVLVYLFVVCTSVQMGLSVLLWQQLACIYMGHTYISHLCSSGKERRQKGMQNLFRFFGCPSLPFRVIQRSSDAGGKSHRT